MQRTGYLAELRRPCKRNLLGNERSGTGTSETIRETRNAVERPEYSGRTLLAGSRRRYSENMALEIRKLPPGHNYLRRAVIYMTV